jgi:hypothetical protein
MRALRWMLGRLDRWLFAAGDPRRLAALRIGLCAVLAGRLAQGAFLGLADQDAALFRPVSFMRMLPGMPPRGVVLAVQVAGVATAVLATVGLRTRVAIPVAWGCGLLLNGMVGSMGKLVHNDALLLLAMVPLLAAPSADAWSVDAALRRSPRPLGLSSRFGWPVRVAMVVVAGAYFFSGLAKLMLSGPAWVLSDNLRFVLYASSDVRATPNALALFIADRPWLAHAIAAATVLVELGFPVVLWRPRAAWLFVPGAIALHTGIWMAMRLDYWAWVATLLVVFVDWPAVADRLRRSPAPLAPVSAVPAVVPPKR